MPTIISEFGYLNVEAGYLAGPYSYLSTGKILQSEGAQLRATIRQEVVRGSQFKSFINNAIDNEGAQLLGKVYTVVSMAAQLRGVVYSIDPEGAQFKSFTDAVDSEGAQLLGQIKENIFNNGAQLFAKNTGLLVSGSQLFSKVSTVNQLGNEFNSGNMAQYPCGDGLYLSNGFYLNTSGGYLQPKFCAFAGAQFRSGISATDTKGAQIRGVIAKTNSYGMQFLGKIYQLPRYGTQFFSKIRQTQSTGAQLRGVIYKTANYGSQFKGTIYKTNAYGLQLTSSRVEKTGVQLRVILYNTSQIRILSEFPSRGDGTSWTVQVGGTASSSSNGFDVNNLNTDIVEQVYRSTSAANVQLVCDTNVPQGVFVDTLGILNHNLTRGATVNFEGSNDPGFLTSELFHVRVTQPNAYWIADELPKVSYRYWRLTIQDPTNPAGYVQIGTVIFGAANVFTTQENFVDRVIFGQKHFTDKVFTEGHTNVSNDRGKKRFLSLEFKNLVYERQNWNILNNIFSTYGVSHKCLWIPEPKRPERFAVFGKLAEIPQEEHNYKDTDADYVAINVTVDESL